jgi:hypothetical protein
VCLVDAAVRTRPPSTRAKPSGKHSRYDDDGMLEEDIESYTSKYRGVSAWQGKWRAYICYKGRNHFLGRFDTEDQVGCCSQSFVFLFFGFFVGRRWRACSYLFSQAALAYDRAALELHGSKAKTNFGDNSGGGIARKYSAKRKKFDCELEDSLPPPVAQAAQPPQLPMMLGPGSMGPVMFNGQAPVMPPFMQSQLCMMLTPQGPMLVQLPMLGMPQSGQIGQRAPVWVPASQPPSGSSGMHPLMHMFPQGTQSAPTFLPPQPTVIPPQVAPVASAPAPVSLPAAQAVDPLSSTLACDPLSAPLSTLCYVALSQPSVTSSDVLTSMNPPL